MIKDKYLFRVNFFSKGIVFIRHIYFVFQATKWCISTASVQLSRKRKISLWYTERSSVWQAKRCSHKNKHYLSNSFSIRTLAQHVSNFAQTHTCINLYYSQPKKLINSCNQPRVFSVMERCWKYFVLAVYFI